MDTYRNMRDVKKTFLEFMDRVPFYGMIVACNDDPLLRKLLPEVQRRTVTYGTKRGSDFLIKIDSPGGNENPHTVAQNATGAGHPPVNSFHVSYQKKDLGEFTLHVPGVHNVQNATAAIAVGIGLDVNVDAIRSALDQFRGWIAASNCAEVPLGSASSTTMDTIQPKSKRRLRPHVNVGSARFTSSSSHIATPARAT